MFFENDDVTDSQIVDDRNRDSVSTRDHL